MYFIHIKGKQALNAKRHPHWLGQGVPCLPWDGFYHPAPGLSRSFPADLGKEKEQGEGTSPSTRPQPGPASQCRRSTCLSVEEKG